MSTEPSAPEAAIPAWQLQENAARTPAYRKNVDDEVFLSRLNAILADFEIDAPDSARAEHPILMFFGVPRCGKTFFSQLVTRTLDIGYVDNVAARFWRAPVVGLRLSRILGIKRAASDFASDYGKTKALGDPHDFHYFWQHWLRITSFPYDPAAERAAIDWAGLGATLRRMSAFWGGPGLLKAIDATYHMQRVLECYPRAVFVYLERDYIDSARSLLKGRMDNFGSADHWYGQAPPPASFASLAALPWHEQIAGQLKHLVDMYEAQLANVPREHVMRISYRAVCSAPETVLNAIEERCRALGSPVARTAGIEPEVIKFSSHPQTDETFALLAAALRKFDLPVRFPASAGPASAGDAA